MSSALVPWSPPKTKALVPSQSKRPTTSLSQVPPFATETFIQRPTSVSRPPALVPRPIERPAAPQFKAVLSWAPAKNAKQDLSAQARDSVFSRIKAPVLEMPTTATTSLAAKSPSRRGPKLSSSNRLRLKKALAEKSANRTLNSSAPICTKEVDATRNSCQDEEIMDPQTSLITNPASDTDRSE